MNYKKIYNEIINIARSRAKPECYCERHHIVPKSMGGSEGKSNIVILTAREHFICHWLLKKIHNNVQCIFAFHCMTKPVGNGRQRYSSHSFKYAREAMSKIMSERMSGKGSPLFGRRGEMSPNFGSKRSDETRHKLSILAKSRKNKNPNRKRIVCIDTGEVFDSICDASKIHKTGNISYALRTGGTAGGLRFKYYGTKYNKNLRGYSCSEGHHKSRSVIDDKGRKYKTVREAGKSVGVSGSAITASIRDLRACRGVVFRYEQS